MMQIMFFPGLSPEKNTILDTIVHLDNEHSNYMTSRMTNDLTTDRSPPDTDGKLHVEKKKQAQTDQTVPIYPLL